MLRASAKLAGREGRDRRLVGVEELLDCVDIERAREQEALSMVTVFALQGLELGALLDTLGERLDVECLAELNECVDERGRPFRSGYAADERAVDLQGVHGELAQVGELAVAGAEIVDRDADPELLEHAEALGGCLGVDPVPRSACWT